METWKEFEANEVTHSVVHHLMAIHELGKNYGGWARVSDIAKRLGITRGSVSINLRSIKARGLVMDDEHHQVKLSPKGLGIVHSVLAKKRIVKTFLVTVLNVPEEQAEIDSCKIEHLISHPTGQRLLRLLRFLTSDDPVARETVQRLRSFEGPCPNPQACTLCKEQCLLDELHLAA